MSNPIIKRQAKRIAIGTVGGLLVLLFSYGLYSNLSQRMILRSDVAAPSLRTILTGIIEYQHTYKTYPPTLSALGGAPATCATVATAAAACLIDNVLASGEKSGYIFRYKAIDASPSGRLDAFTITSDPVNEGSTKQRHFFTDQTGVIRVETGRPATAASPPAD
jgi:type IV pilus assembly protein PilA